MDYTRDAFLGRIIVVLLRVVKLRGGATIRAAGQFRPTPKIKNFRSLMHA